MSEALPHHDAKHAAESAVRERGRGAHKGQQTRAAILEAALSLASAPSSHWDRMLVGHMWLECLVSIPIIAVLPFAALVWAVRRFAAPTDLVRTGALAGLAAGGISAMGYALHCMDDSVPFVALWYGGTIAFCTLAGGLLGHTQVIGRLQVHPVLRRGPEEAGQAQRRVRADATTLPNDVVHARRRHVQTDGQTTGRQPVRGHELGAEDGAWVHSLGGSHGRDGI